MNSLYINEEACSSPIQGDEGPDAVQVLQTLLLREGDSSAGDVPEEAEINKGQCEFRRAFLRVEWNF